MKTIEEYLAAIDETFVTADTTMMNRIVDDLKVADVDIAYNVLMTAMGIGSISTNIDLKKVKWVHHHAIETVLEIIRYREAARRVSIDDA